LSDSETQHYQGFRWVSFRLLRERLRDPTQPTI